MVVTSLLHVKDEFARKGLFADIESTLNVQASAEQFQDKRFSPEFKFF